jgi:antitoxin YxxD
MYMSNFDFLKQYTIELVNASKTEPKMKFKFYKIDENDILEAEQRLNILFPKELKDFYKEIGPGFLKTSGSGGIKRIMGPDNLADFKLEEGMYEGTSFCADYNSDKSKIVFFEAFEEVFFSIEMNGKDKNPIYFSDIKIADSLEEFLHKMDEDNNFYEALLDNI